MKYLKVIGIVAAVGVLAILSAGIIKKETNLILSPAQEQEAITLESVDSESSPGEDAVLKIVNDVQEYKINLCTKDEDIERLTESFIELRDFYRKYGLRIEYHIYEFDTQKNEVSVYLNVNNGVHSYCTQQYYSGVINIPVEQ